jgi:hypothetical protein
MSRCPLSSPQRLHSTLKFRDEPPEPSVGKGSHWAISATISTPPLVSAINHVSRQRHGEGERCELEVTGVEGAVEGAVGSCLMRTTVRTDKDGAV